MEKVRYAEMLPHEIVERRHAFPAAFIGLGTLEWHGEHLAVGNDALKAEALCDLAAARSGGFAMPTLWWGEPRVADLLELDYDADGRIKAFMGWQPHKLDAGYYGRSPAQQIASYQELLRHVLVQMNVLEMRAVCLVCGHYPLYNWVAPVVDQFNATFRDTQAFAGIEFHYPGEGTEVGGDHAAKWETSYLWYLRPDCVDMSVFLDRDAEEAMGIYGEDPRGTASVALGRRGCELIVEGMVAKAHELIARSAQRD